MGEKQRFPFGEKVFKLRTRATLNKCTCILEANNSGRDSCCCGYKGKNSSKILVEQGGIRASREISKRYWVSLHSSRGQLQTKSMNTLLLRTQQHCQFTVSIIRGIYPTRVGTLLRYILALVRLMEYSSLVFLDFFACYLAAFFLILCARCSDEGLDGGSCLNK